MSATIDVHGQPPRAINYTRCVEREVTEVLGICKGLLADGVLVNSELAMLNQWAAHHPEAVRRPIVRHLFSRLQRAFADGHIDEAERRELKLLMRDLVGGALSLALGQQGATALPLDDPPPLVCWEREVYVFTGRFAWGTRSDCHMEVLSRGGGVEENVTRRTTFLVVGSFGSRDWLHTPYGRKIEYAAKLRDGGLPLRIIGEDHWARAL